MSLRGHLPDGSLPIGIITPKGPPMPFVYSPAHFSTIEALRACTDRVPQGAYGFVESDGSHWLFTGVGWVEHFPGFGPDFSRSLARLINLTTPKETPMPDKYIPAVGDRARLSGWKRDQYIDVTFVGASWLVGTAQDGYETPWNLNPAALAGHWEKVPTFTEGWLNIYPFGATVSPRWHPSRFDADRFNATVSPRWHPSRFDADRFNATVRIGVLHLFLDGHTEMEAP